MNNHEIESALWELKNENNNLKMSISELKDTIKILKYEIYQNRYAMGQLINIISEYPDFYDIIEKTNGII